MTTRRGFRYAPKPLDRAPARDEGGLGPAYWTAQRDSETGHDVAVSPGHRPLAPDFFAGKIDTCPNVAGADHTPPTRQRAAGTAEGRRPHTEYGKLITVHAPGTRGPEEVLDANGNWAPWRPCPGRS